MKDITAVQTNIPKTRSARRAVLRWIPTALLLLTIVACWTVVLQGGRTGIVGWYLVQMLAPLVGLGVGMSVAVYAVWKRRRSLPIWLSLFLALVALWPLGWLFRMGQIAYPSSITATTPSVAVRLPADVPLQVSWGGDSVAVNYHAAYPDQRWAFDLVVEPSMLGSAKLEDYGCWGVEVVAPAAGEVALAQDGLPDEVPGRISNNVMAPTGNHVVLKLMTGTYLVIAHLQRDSVAVVVGDQVREGQVIGRCGNSGNTSEPHIHIHHQRQHPANAGGFAEGLPLYFRDHDGIPMPEGGIRIVDGHAVPQGALVQHIGP